MFNYIQKFSIIVLVLSAISLYGCKKDEDEASKNTLSITPQLIEIDADGGAESLVLNTDASSWSINNTSDWVQLSTTEGNGTQALISLSVNTISPEFRETTLTATAGNAEPQEIKVSQLASEFIYSLSSNLSSLSFKRAGNTLSIKVETDAPSWTISDESGWLTYSPDSGESGSSVVEITAPENDGEDDRETNIIIQAQYAEDVIVEASQKGEYYPSYNTNPLPPDATGMEKTAMEIAGEMTIGWNIGNTLEAIGGETAWGNPRVSPELIQLVKDNGFNAIRIPCSWNQNMSNIATAQLDVEWLERVKEVVNYCVERDMYVILNIHWDGGWLENNVTPTAQEANNAKQKAFWEQIATYMRDIDEHLLFASTNEPNVENATQMAVLNSYHQTCIDAVRSTGGKNTYRTIVIQGPSTDIEKTHQLMNELPTDEIPNRMMAEIHYYTPWNFCGLEADASWGDMFYYWGEDYHSETEPERNATYGEEDTVDEFFDMMKTQFYNQGIPIILGEYSATRRTNLTGESLQLHLDSRAYFLYYVTKMARANGMIPFFWDNGHTGTFGSGIFDRSNNTVYDQQAVDALIQGANE